MRFWTWSWPVVLSTLILHPWSLTGDSPHLTNTHMCTVFKEQCHGICLSPWVALPPVCRPQSNFQHPLQLINCSGSYTVNALHTHKTAVFTHVTLWSCRNFNMITDCVSFCHFQQGHCKRDIQHSLYLQAQPTLGSSTQTTHLTNHVHEHMTTSIDKELPLPTQLDCA